MAQGLTFNQPTTPRRSISDIYASSIEQGAEDYSSLMSGYRKLSRPRGVDQIPYNPVTSLYTFNRVSPTFAKYQGMDPAATSALRSITETGGYSPEDIGAIRERSISPIRSIYANAMRNLGRIRTIQGGYSPSHGAVTSRMARELSEQIGQRSTDVNAQIAQMVASGKLSAASQLAPILSREAEMKQQIELANTESSRRANELNQQTKLQVEQLIRSGNEREAERVTRINEANQAAIERENARRLQALEGARGLYGTTPALAQLFGQQALASRGQELEAGRLSEEIRRGRAQTGLGLISATQRGGADPRYSRVVSQSGYNPNYTPPVPRRGRIGY